MGNFIQHKRAVDSLNKTFSNYDKGNRHSGYLQEQGKRDIITDVAEQKERLLKKIGRCVPYFESKTETNFVKSEDGTICFVWKMPEEKAEHTGIDKEEYYGRIDGEGKLEIYHVGGIAQAELDALQAERTQEIQTIVDRELEQLEREMQEHKEYTMEKSFSQRLIATITGKKPKMAKHKEMKKAMEDLPEKLEKGKGVVEQSIEQQTEKSFDESLQEQVISETEVKYDISETKYGVIQDKDEIE